MTGQIPPFLLVDVLRNLDTKDLLRTQSVSKTFHEELTTRAPLRRILFTLPPCLSPAAGVPLKTTYDLHPIFRLVEYIPGIIPLRQRVILRGSERQITRYPACLAFACSPASTKIEIELRGLALVVEDPEGVNVFGVLRGLEALSDEGKTHEREVTLGLYTIPLRRIPHIPNAGHHSPKTDTGIPQSAGNHSPAIVQEYSYGFFNNPLRIGYPLHPFPPTTIQRLSNSSGG
ncbi:hypothetical protein HOY82DRAFT_668546 [Tuber indicum]|nr:hypothetical protein HOY82DRAFT_668546 [Tuber indicum]